MKFSKKILAAALCAAMLCVPTLAAGSKEAPGAGAYVPDPQYAMVWGTATWQDNGSLLVRRSGENKPTDGMVLWTKNAVVLDAVTGGACGHQRRQKRRRCIRLDRSPGCNDHEPAAPGCPGIAVSKHPRRF